MTAAIKNMTALLILILLTSPPTAAEDTPPLSTRAVGDVETPTFWRRDIGAAPGRLHEPTAGADGSIWTSPLDGTLWRYDTKSGATEIIDLEKLSGRSWKGLHLWPIAHGDDVYLCTPGLPQLWVWHRAQNRVAQYPFPHEKPAVYGGFVVPEWDHVYLYDTNHAAVLKWDPQKLTGELFPCPYKLTGTLYMTFAEPERQEVWGSTYTGNDLVCFDVPSAKWTAHVRSPLEKATPTAGAKVFGETLFVSDHLNGRIMPYDIARQEWGDPLPVPGYKDWFGYVSGGFHFRGKLYFCHSTWTGGAGSLDGEPHHFLGTWSVFDPTTRKFSRLDLPVRDKEDRKYFMADYSAVVDGELYILAVDQRAPHTAMVVTTKTP